MARFTLLIEVWDDMLGGDMFSGYERGWRKAAEIIEEWHGAQPKFNEALFCTHCGRVWARRRYPAIPELSWWIDFRKCDEPPFTTYDLDNVLTSTPNVQEYIASEFLSDPSRFGYSESNTRPGDSPLGSVR